MWLALKSLSRSSVKISIGGKVSQPVTLNPGWQLVQVQLPADALDWPADRIRIVLAHELAHVRRGDWIVQLAVELLCAAYWFNPLVWLAARRLRLESEQACDDAVLTLGVEGSEYATELVDLARAFRSDRQPFVPAAAIARPSSLERRVRAMLNVKLNRDPITRTASIAAAVVLAAVTVLVAGFGVSAQGQFATVSGGVVDQNGRPINRVRLVLSNAAAQTKNEVTSDASGHYEFVGIPGGTYELLFEVPGMSSIKRGVFPAEGRGIPSLRVRGVLYDTAQVVLGDSAMIAVGIVGCNYGRNVLLPAFRSDPRCEVVALAGNDERRTAELARAANVARGFGGWQSLVEDRGVAVVAIAVPPAIQIPAPLVLSDKGH